MRHSPGRAVLALNAGSSSIKFGLFAIDVAGPRTLSHGQVEGIGTAPRFVARDPAGTVLAEHRSNDSGRTHEALLGELLDWAVAHLGADGLAGVGHRVVHGGASHHAPILVTADLLAELDRLTPLAPLHQPHSLSPIRAIAARHPELPQVACFDTGFHHAMPAVATRFALPREYEALGVRRYGFHGLSYEYVAGALRGVSSRLARGRTVVAHLGSGASLCAMLEGRSVDTTMGFTALDGLVMGTRCGAIDPGVVLYLQQACGMTVADVEDLLYHRSGLLGVSGISSDMRVLAMSDEAAAHEATELFVFRVAREVAALTASLGGLDGLVFTAGIGEHIPEIRAAVCRRLGWLGLELDEAANGAGRDLVSTSDSRVEVRVIATDEEAMIARHTVDVIGDAGGRDTTV